MTISHQTNHPWILWIQRFRRPTSSL